MPRFPESRPPTVSQLRDLWRQYRGNGVVQRVILEIQHLRGFVCKVEALRRIIQRCWYEEAGSKLVALESLRAELQAEMFRAGVVTDASPPRPLPPFMPPSRYDVRALAQFRTDDESIQTLVDEIEHARAFVVRVEELHTVIQRCWRSETDTDLVALLTLRELVETEKNRAGIIVAAEPAKREQPGLTGRIALDFP